MSRKTIIIIITTFIISTAGAFLWLYFSNQTITPPITTPNDYNPFGTSSSAYIPVSNPSEDNINNQLPGILSPDKLRQVSNVPTSGFSITENSKTEKTDIHYTLRSNGNIYETYTDSPETKRLSNTTVPKVYEAVWLPDGIRLIIRYLKDNTENIQTFSVKINPATTTLNEFAGGIDGNHLPDNISTLAVSPTGDKIFYLTAGATGSTGYISQPTGLNKKVLFNSPLTDWLASWPKEGIITLNTKPSATIPGFMYFINSTTGNFTRIVGGVLGLTTKTNVDASQVLYSDSSKRIPDLYLLDIKSGENRLLPWNTLPEKCTWSNTDNKILYCTIPKSFPAGDYPDTWYQGLVNFTDDVWMINTDTMASTLVFDISKSANKNIDATDIQIDKNDNFLFFINKTDLTFWSLNIK